MSRWTSIRAIRPAYLAGKTTIGAGKATIFSNNDATRALHGGTGITAAG